MIEGGWLDLVTVDLFWPYAVFFWGTVLLRLVFRRITRAELLVLGLLVLHHVLEIVQLGVGGDWHFSMLPHRYFGVAAPIAWCWTAYGVVRLWTLPQAKLRLLGRLAVLALVLYSAGYLGAVKLNKEYRRGSAQESMDVAKVFAPIIRADYKGPARRDPFPYTVKEYFTGRRPVVIGDYVAAAWVLRAQGAMWDNPFPFREDYRILSTKAPAPKDSAGRDWPVIGKAQGHRLLWLLYRNPEPSVR